MLNLNLNNLKLSTKGGTDSVQVDNRIKYKTEVYEFHLNEDDLFGEKYINLRKQIERLQDLGIKVFLHQPMKIRNTFLHVNKTGNSIEGNFLNLTTNLLIDLCKEYNLRCVVHLNYGTINDDVLEEAVFANKSDYILTVSNVLRFLETFDPERKYLMFENGVIGTGAYRKDMYLANLIKDTDIPLCVDISHLAISLNQHLEGVVFENKEIEVKELNDYIFNTLTLLNDNIVYYHVVDSVADNGLHDGLCLGDGVVDWSRIKELILEKDYIYEIGLKDFKDCVEMVEAHNYFKNI